MTGSSVTARGRAFAESLMSSTCTVRARSSGRTTDPDTGEVVHTPGAVIYTGPCRLRPGSQQGTATGGVGGDEVFLFDYIVDLPFSAVGVKQGHRVTIDQSPDPDAVDLEVEVQRPYPGDQIVRRRLYCSEVA